MGERIYNFNPGPAALPLPVLEEIKAEFLSFKGSGMSILEISHRSKEFDAVLADAVARVKRLMGLGEDFEVLFLQGGASTQFFMAPMNFLTPGDTADYINTGTWSTKAIKEAEKMGCDIKVVASSEDRNFCYIPQNIEFTKGARYVHLTSNNTIKGTQFAKFPATGGAPMVADMSSDIMSRVIDPRPFGLIYAGAQKNLGPAGVTLVIIRKDMLERVNANMPSMLQYKSHVEKNSGYNTTPCFGVYVVQLVLKWLEETVGGVAAVEKLNQEKARVLYQALDATDYYNATADPDSRSLMNVTFRLPSEELEKKFVAQALEAGLGGLKGHRSVGGCRASIYNAMELAGVEALAAFMKDFMAANG